jgi:hypothetical protein
MLRARDCRKRNKCDTKCDDGAHVQQSCLTMRAMILGRMRPRRGGTGCLTVH